MKIQSIEINNYKAFYGKHSFNIKGKNLFIYGENGSGKSSLFYALKDFFQSSNEDIDLNEVENIFIKDDQKGQCFIEVTFTPDGRKNKNTQVYTFATSSKNTSSSTDTSIRDANNLKSFLTYKNLLDIHHIKKDQQIDLFDLLVKGVLKHFKYSLSGGKELGQLWKDAETAIQKETGRDYKITDKRKDVDFALKVFNDAFSELFNPNSPEYILKHAQPFIDEFSHDIALKLFYTEAKAASDYKSILENHVRVQLTYAGKPIKHPHLFLNEARLSAIAISVYLGMIKRHIQLIPCKILFLDDIFIGLDMGNRLPLLRILQTHFQRYQLFITTYDKPWYEFAKAHLENSGDKNWTTMEFYAQKTMEGYEIPMICDKPDLLSKAKKHFKSCDYKAAAVYARAAFERTLRKYCMAKHKPVPFKENMKDYTTEVFWKIVETDVQPATKAAVEQFRSLVLNPYSHYNTEKHEIKTELNDAIETIEKLRTELFPPRS